MLVTIGEVVVLWYLVQPWTWSFDQYASAGFIMIVISIYVQAITLTGYKAFIEPFDFLSMCPERARRGSRISLLTGRSVWRNLFKDESRTIVALRGVSAIAIIGGLLAFLITKVVLEPIHETGWVPSKLYTSISVPDNLRLESDSSWKIIVFLQIDEYTPELVVDGILEDYWYAVHVKPLWSGSPDGPDCTQITSVVQAALSPWITAIEIHCPNRLPGSANLLSINGNPSSDIWPDLLVQVNFSALYPLESIDHSFEPSNARSSTVYVDVGLTANVDAILENTIPIPLVSNAHLLGPIQVTIRQQFREGSIASMNVFGTTANFFVARIPYLLPDPSISSSVNDADDTATLRLYMQADFTSWRFESDYREKSVWVGLSAVGGFWTSLNGFFALLFGTSLLRILFDVKPLSTFGLLHKFKGARLGEYPSVFSEGTTPPGLIAYLRDHFIDISPIGSDEASDRRRADFNLESEDSELALIGHNDDGDVV
ncbi:hypothetical protein BDZ89DRAFT_1074931 [Hymenopellis radicata]|nr:hypothetical protein BDZ89DRAFT_1074931 [Hymenopellis radicata]